MNGPFDRVEFNRALLKCRDNSSPGRDGIEYKMIKNLSEYLKDSLLDCMNEAFIKSYVIQDWKNLQTIFISKKDKMTVRPITMSSCVGKILERMINERIIWLAEREGWFDKDQNGFRRGRSSVDNLVGLVSDIEIVKRTNQNLIGVFLDISSAYDNVRINVIGDILKAKECGGVS